MDNQPVNQPTLGQPAPQEYTPISPPQNPPKTKQPNRIPIVVAIALILLAGTAYGVYSWQHKKVNDLNVKVNSLQSQLSKLQPSSTSTSSNYRGGPNGVKLTESTNEEMSQTLTELALYNQQNGQYPQSDTNIMAQNYQRYGYDGIAAGANLKCPQENGYISYAGYTNPTTNKVDRFDIYYCNGNSVGHKTQADIPQANKQ